MKKPEYSESNVTAKTVINEELIRKDLEFAGYNLLVTSEINMSDNDIYNSTARKNITIPYI